MGTLGKSGSLFFFSNDIKFIVKTLPKREARHMSKEPYIHHSKDDEDYKKDPLKPVFGSQWHKIQFQNAAKTKRETCQNKHDKYHQRDLINHKRDLQKKPTQI